MKKKRGDRIEWTPEEWAAFEAEVRSHGNTPDFSDEAVAKMAMQVLPPERQRPVGGSFAQQVQKLRKGEVLPHRWHKNTAGSGKKTTSIPLDAIPARPTKKTNPNQGELQLAPGGKAADVLRSLIVVRMERMGVYELALLLAKLN